LIAKMRRKKVLKIIICKRKLLKHKMLLLYATTIKSTIVENALTFTVPS